jgi:microcystin-dependent protein
MNNEKPQASMLTHDIINLMPVGTIMPFAGDAEAAKELNEYGWYLCDGTALDLAGHHRLFNILGETCGKETDKIVLPDLRGTFLRGVDVVDRTEGIIRDPDSGERTRHASTEIVGNKVLSRQADAVKSHKHDLPEGKGSLYVDTVKIFMGDSHAFDNFHKAPEGQDIFTADAGGKEMRPINVSVNYIIYAGCNNSPL